ncbi:MAG: SCP2 sterol-binding domain-containing protein [Alphaproteobacteria bacterium]|nr:SCP2 sterol-binding domain-containing protein [Alphaproteobacteria bacterium]
MNLEQATVKIKEKIQFAPHIKAKVKFDFGDDGRIYIDSNESPVLVSHEDEESDVTLACSLETFQAFLEGTKDPNIAFMMGQLKVRGSMGLALKLNAVLED